MREGRRGRERGLKKTGRDRMGEKTGSVDRGEGLLGGVEQSGTERVRWGDKESEGLREDTD